MRLALAYALGAYLLYKGAIQFATIWGWWVGVLYWIAAPLWPAYEIHRKLKRHIYDDRERDEGQYHSEDLMDD